MHRCTKKQFIPRDSSTVNNIVCINGSTSSQQFKLIDVFLSLLVKMHGINKPELAHSLDTTEAQ
jgi:hypothetical protein